MNLSSLLLRLRPVELAAVLKTILCISYREVRVAGRNFWLDPASNFGSRLMRDGFYDKEFTAEFCALLKPGDTVVDLGANEGYFSVLGSEMVGETGRVYSIEPQARLWPVIIRNFMLNRLTNYTLVPYAVGDFEGFIDLKLFPSLNTGASTAVKGWRQVFFGTQKAGIMPLRRIFETFRIPKVALMKIDIEGFELNALRSLGKLLDDGIVENFLIEFHAEPLKKLGQSVEECCTMLENAGYRRVKAVGEGEWWRKPIAPAGM